MTAGRINQIRPPPCGKAGDAPIGCTPGSSHRLGPLSRCAVVLSLYCSRERSGSLNQYDTEPYQHCTTEGHPGGTPDALALGVFCHRMPPSPRGALCSLSRCLLLPDPDPNCHRHMREAAFQDATGQSSSTIQCQSSRGQAPLTTSLGFALCCCWLQRDCCSAPGGAVAWGHWGDGHSPTDFRLLCCLLRVIAALPYPPCDGNHLSG
jgi:hypothetical protein